MERGRERERDRDFLRGRRKHKNYFSGKKLKCEEFRGDSTRHSLGSKYMLYTSCTL